MPAIGTTIESYTTFMTQMRGAFNVDTEFIASYGENEFLYTVTKGKVEEKKEQAKPKWQPKGKGVVIPPPTWAPRNLYLTGIRRGGDTKTLTQSELAYGSNAVGNISKKDFIEALDRDFVNSFRSFGHDFDIVLLCTIEAARSAVIETWIKNMLASDKDQQVAAHGDNIKMLAQKYGQTQESTDVATWTTYRPLTQTDYMGVYNRDSKKFQPELIPKGLTEIRDVFL